MHMKEKKLWIRELSCGHERDTDVAYVFGDYKKPKVGSHAYCRECMKEVRIIGVREA